MATTITIANLEFDAAGQFKAAVAAEGGVVFGDVPNFSNKNPVACRVEQAASGEEVLRQDCSSGIRRRRQTGHRRSGRVG